MRRRLRAGVSLRGRQCALTHSLPARKSRSARRSYRLRPGRRQQLGAQSPPDIRNCGRLPGLAARALNGAFVAGREAGEAALWNLKTALLQGSGHGEARPGVAVSVALTRECAQAVTKLFNVVEPDVAVFGLKDYQQYRVVKTLVRELNFDVEIVGGPIHREPDGLAMSR